MSMIHIELKKRLPADRSELDFYHILQLYDFCRSYFTAHHTANQVLPTPLQSVRRFLAFDYNNELKIMRIQFFDNIDCHEPEISFICTPSRISELRYSEGQKVIKQHRPYVDAVGSGASWQVVKTNAPRELHHLSREKIPTFREQLLEEIRCYLLLQIDKKEKKDPNIYMQRECQRYETVMGFLRKVKLEGFNQEEMSPAFIRNLCMWWPTIMAGLTHLYHPHWDEKDDNKMIVKTLRTFAGEDQADSAIEQFVDHIAEVQGRDKSGQFYSRFEHLGGWVNITKENSSGL